MSTTTLLKRQVLKEIPVKIVDDFKQRVVGLNDHLRTMHDQVRRKYSGQPEKLHHDVSQNLHQLKLYSLKAKAKLFGFRVEDQYKYDIVNKVTLQAVSGIQCLMQQQPWQVVTVDIGTKNLAWCYLTTQAQGFECKLLAGEVRSLKGTMKFPRNWLECYAQESHNLVQYISKIVKIVQAENNYTESNLSYVMEQQMSLYNPKCSIVESQLHVLWHPNAISISPRSVADFFKTGKQGLADYQVAQEFLFSGYQFKKDVTVGIVEEMFRQGLVNASPKLLEMWNESAKKDDLADAITNALYSFNRQRELVAYVMSVII